MGIGTLHKNIYLTHTLKTLINLKALFLLLLLSGCDSSYREEARLPNAREVDPDRLSMFAEEARQYCQSRNLSTDFFILIDLSRHSGVKRFFVWDFKQNRVSESYLVSHGSCDNPWSMDFSKENAGVSNVDGSHCSSVGKYIIGERGPSQWGIRVKYLLHGQEPTNSNATKRAIVFHSWEWVSDEEVYPAGTPEGWGCPAVSDNAMRAVDQRLRSTDKRVLMWVTQ